MSEQKKLSDTDMAGPHTNREKLSYKVPLPQKNAPVYFGEPAYQEKHKNGWSEEEYQRGLEQATHDFNPARVGEGRVQDWKKGVPERNQQGYENELLDISYSSPTTDRTYGDPNRNRGQK
jgi:hypothetical protein